jgi:hypothetical protein
VLLVKERGIMAPRMDVGSGEGMGPRGDSYSVCCARSCSRCTAGRGFERKPASAQRMGAAPGEAMPYGVHIALSVSDKSSLRAEGDKALETVAARGEVINAVRAIGSGRPMC